MSQRTSPYPGAQAVSRAIAVLKAFSDAQPRLTLAEITRRTRLNRATAYRLLSALEKEGLVTREAGAEAYQLGPQAIVLGSRALRATSLRPAGGPELEALAQATHETASLEILTGRDILILDEVLSANLVGGAPSLGTRWPAHATSTGKALLAFASEAEVSAFLRRALPAFTPHTLATPEALRAALARVRKQGFATVADELEIGYSAVAAPVFNHLGQAAAALCVGGPTLRLTPKRLAEIAPLVRQAARRVSERLGYSPAHPENTKTPRA
jgi:DNA-binding IclR family transcriptional regulator